jgi:hypothetical protein
MAPDLAHVDSPDHHFQAFLMVDASACCLPESLLPRGVPECAVYELATQRIYD